MRPSIGNVAPQVNTARGPVDSSDLGVTLMLPEHLNVLFCLILGIPHEDLGQVRYVQVQTADGSALTNATVQDFLRDGLENYKVPATVEFVDRPLCDDARKARRSVCAPRSSSPSRHRRSR
ncbi:hypothetical protein BH11ACT6_BH11ACT6_42930 [soil metagenome]